jgi:hypothetical protein
MSATLAKVDRIRLAKLLALIGSDHAGERDAAALAAHRLVQSRGMTWGDVMQPPAIEKALPELGTWRVTVAQCLVCPGSLRPWERTFLADVTQFRRLSTKQRYCIKTIADRVLGGAR